MDGLIPLLLLALAFVLLIVLPQRARSRTAQRTQQMQSQLTIGTEVMTTSGVYGTVAALGDKTIDLEIAPGVVVRWALAAVAQVTPAAADEAEAPAEDAGPPVEPTTE